MSEKELLNQSPAVPDTKAIAVRRDSENLPPRITAKGHGFNAEKILDIAFAEGVKVRQDKDLTELLDAFEVESPVPLEALHAVSLILERVYAENQRRTSPSLTPEAPVKDTVERSDVLRPEEPVTSDFKKDQPK